MEEPQGNVCLNFLKFHWEGIFTVLVPLIFSPIMFADKDHVVECRCTYIVVVMAFYWVSEVIPLYVTAMIPVFAFPIMGILDSQKTCLCYFKDPNVMLLGGLVVAFAIEFSNLHQRIALKTILTVGCSPRRLHFGLVCVTSFISFWTLNSAATAMMCPIIKAVLDELHSQNIINMYMDDEKDSTGEGPHLSKIGLAYYFGVAYGATIGGCASLIGTSTNLTFKGIYETRFPDATEKITFLLFMAYTMPLVIVNVLLLYLTLQITHMGLCSKNSYSRRSITRESTGAAIAGAKAIIVGKYNELGPMTIHELEVAVLFVTMIFVLFMRTPGVMKGWADVLNTKLIKNSAPIIAIVVIFFLLPKDCSFFKHCSKEGPYPTQEIPSVLNWSYINNNFPWGLLFLIGGGFAVADGMIASGTTKYLGKKFEGLKVLPIYTLELASAFFGIFFTCFSSNVAMCNVLVPILAEVAVTVRVHPLLLIYPAGLGCSFAFLLPVSTPPNAIISGYAKMKTKYMIQAGIIPTLVALITLFLNCLTWHNVIYPNSNTFPDWATEKPT